VRLLPGPTRHNPARTRGLVALCLAVLLTTGAAVALARILIAHGFASLESDATRQGIERIRRALEHDWTTLDESATRAAQWEGTRAALGAADAAHIATPITPEQLDSVHVQLLWIVDAQGATASALALEGGGRTLVPLSAAELEALRRSRALAATGAAHGRLLRMPHGPIAFGTAPLMRRDGTRAGTLLVGRYLDHESALRAAQATELPVAITLLGEHSGEALRLPEEVRRWIASDPQARVPVLQLRDAGMLHGYALLRDVAGEPVAVLSTGFDRATLKLDRQNVGEVIALTAGAFGIVVVALLFALGRGSRARALMEWRYQSVGRQLEESIVLADAGSGAIVEANPALARALGYPVEELMALRLEELSPALRPQRLARLREALSGRSRVLTLKGKAGRRFAAEVSFSWIRLDRQVLVCLIARDVTARRKLERQRREHRRRLARLAHRDALTGLPNRLYLQMRLPKLVAAARESGSHLALLYLDLDHFKDVNDSLGHSSGDRLLTVIARRLRGCVSSEDLVVRMGGDEFVVVALGLSGATAAEHIARRIIQTVSAPLDLAGVRFGVLASIGISVCPGDGDNLEQLLKAADIALFHAKSSGRGNHQFFTGEMQSRLSERLELEQSLRRAIGAGQLFLEYQPSFDLQTRAAVGFEALVRWNHPQHGVVPPGRFIPLAEQSNLIVDLGVWVLRQVCRQLAEWRAQGLTLLPVSINVNSRQFEHGRLVETVAGLTREFDLDANLLHFEITESAAMHNSEAHLGALQSLRKLGSRILIDDFGTGYSSLSYLKHLPIDTLKIDRAFVHDMASDSNDAAIVSAIIGIASALGLHVVAEGVETAEHVTALMKLGCRTAQGFFFARPLSAADARVMLENLAARRRTGDTARLAILRGPLAGS